jgi:hypothetical protein
MNLTGPYALAPRHRGGIMKVIERESGYYKGKPVMILRPAKKDNGKRFIIKLDDLWKYSDTHNVQFMGFMTGRVMQLCQLFEIDVPTHEQQFVQLMTSIADTIMGGIDDLVKMQPYQKESADPSTVVDKQYEVSEEATGSLH